MPYGEKRPRLVAWQSKKLTMNSNSSKLSMDYNSQRPLVTTLEDDGYSETKKIVCKIFVKNEWLRQIALVQIKYYNNNYKIRLTLNVNVIKYYYED